MKIAKLWWIGMPFLCVALICAAPFFLGIVGISGPPWTDRVTEAQKAALSRETRLHLPAGSRFLIYGEGTGKDLEVYYKLRLTDGDLRALLAQPPLRDASWNRGEEGDLAWPDSPPAWKPGRSRKARSTQVSLERNPGDGATDLRISIDPNQDGTDDVYLMLMY